MMQKIVTIVHCLFAIGASCVCTGAESEPDAPVYLQIPGYDELEFSGCAPAPGDGQFWVCSDENKKTVWRINAVSGAVESFDWDAKKLDDIEGLASDGRRSTRAGTRRSHGRGLRILRMGTGRRGINASWRDSGVHFLMRIAGWMRTRMDDPSRAEWMPRALPTTAPEIGCGWVSGDPWCRQRIRRNQVIVQFFSS